MTDEEIKNTIVDTVSKIASTKNFIKKNKTSIILSIISMIIIFTSIFLGGFFTARKIYKVENVDQQVMSLQSKLDEATFKLNEIQNKYDELIILNDKMNDQATSVKKDIEDAQRIINLSNITIEEIKNIANNGNTEVTDIISSINTLVQNNKTIKDKVIILEKNLKDLELKIASIPE